MCRAFCIIIADLTHTPFEKNNHPHFIKGQDSHHSGSQRQACIGTQVNLPAKARLLPPSFPAHQLLSRGLCGGPSVPPGCCMLATSTSEIPKLQELRLSQWPKHRLHVAGVQEQTFWWGHRLLLPEAPTPLLGHGGRGVQKKGTQVSFSPHYLPAKVARPLSPRVHTCDMEVKGLSHRVAVKTGDEVGKEVGCDQDRGRWEAACHVSELARGCKEKQRGTHSYTLNR